MYSFYGGRPGNSFIIVTTYRSIKDMVDNFKKGPEYTVVHYDEHVMINAVNKNDPDNGKLYRRGYEFTNNMGGAEYIGTIVGPSGKAPLLEMTTIAEVEKKQRSEGFEERRSSGEYKKENMALVPGKTVNGDYNDSITWACCSIRNSDSEDTTAYIGFTFPYTVIDFESSTVEPYKSGNYSDTSSVTRQDDREHPFYEKWHINIPNGIKGDAFKNLKVETASSTIQSYNGQTDDITNNRKVLVYDYYHYDNKQNGEPKKIYLGDYNMIENISMSDDGTITIDYSHDDNSVFNQKVKWITSVNLNTTNGKLTVNYNHGTAYTTDLDWINGVDIADDGTVTFNHTHNNDTVFSKKIKWCTGVTINNDGTVTFKWNNSTQDTVFDNIIQWIDAVNLANNGTLTITYNIPDEEHPQEKKKQIFSNAIKWIDTINLNQNGTLTVTYNTSEQENFQNAIKSITSITHSVNNNANPSHGHNGELSINYNNGEPDVINLDLLTGIDMDEDGMITAQWNNDNNSISELGAINFIKDLLIDNNGNLLVQYSNKYGETEVNGELGWTWLGKIAPYGNNTNMTISRILRGKHFIEDNKNYLEFYIENVGLLRSGDTAIISGGTATMYLNGTQVGTNSISLSGVEITSSSSGLSTLNFKIELDNSAYPVTNSPDLVDVQLKNVIINITRTNVADAVTNLSDQMTQINTNAANISRLNTSLGTTNTNITNINRNINSLNTSVGKNTTNLQQLKTNLGFKMMTINSSSSFFNSSRFSLKGGVINIYYNDFVLIVQGDIAPTRNIARNEDVDILNFSTANLPHHFDDTNNTRVPLTRQLAGRNIMVNKANNRIYYHDVGFTWGAGSTTDEKDKATLRLDLVIPFDLTT